MEISIIDGHSPDPNLISRELRLRLRNVDLHIGNKSENSSGVALPDAILIWSERSRNFEKNIEKIKIDASAQRFPRKYD